MKKVILCIGVIVALSQTSCTKTVTNTGNLKVIVPPQSAIYTGTSLDLTRHCFLYFGSVSAASSSFLPQPHALKEVAFSTSGEAEFGDLNVGDYTVVFYYKGSSGSSFLTGVQVQVQLGQSKAVTLSW